MKFRILLCVLAALAAFALPFLLLPKAAPQEAPPVTEPSVPETVQTAPVESFDDALTLRVQTEDGVRELSLHDYLTGVVLAEMPTDFASEALKAQAVAARTYTLHKMAQGAIARHPDADACDDITCCKAYETAEDAAAGWGAGALYYEEKLARAVAETDGEVIVYDGEPVLAVFFSSAAGHTQGAGEVWQTDLPYLQSVDSPEDDSLVPNYYSVVTFTAQEFRDRFLAVYPAAKLNGDAGSFLTDITRNDAGFVSTLRVGGVTVRGNELRTILGLRSPSFTVEVSGDTLTFAGITAIADSDTTADYAFGYADVTPNGSPDQYGDAVNPYTPYTSDKTGGDGFDLEWAVDISTGLPVDVTGKTFHYVRVYSAVLDFGRFGETSAEITGIFTTANKATTSVGRTALCNITLDGTAITDYTSSTIGNVTVYDTDGLIIGDESTIAVTGTSSTANVYINNVRATEYTATEDDQIIRVIIQDGTAAPRIIIIK